MIENMQNMHIFEDLTYFEHILTQFDNIYH